MEVLNEKLYYSLYIAMCFFYMINRNIENKKCHVPSSVHICTLDIHSILGGAGWLNELSS
jgi:hypothetical protein